jgi:hypothetical protein
MRSIHAVAGRGGLQPRLDTLAVGDVHVDADQLVASRAVRKEPAAAEQPLLRLPAAGLPLQHAEFQRHAAFRERGLAGLPQRLPVRRMHHRHEPVEGRRAGILHGIEAEQAEHLG